LIFKIIINFYLQDNLLCRIEGQDQEIAKGQEEEVGRKEDFFLNTQVLILFQCVVCGTNRASMQTQPCAHQVNLPFVYIQNKITASQTNQ
jgi:hypothetical protein